MKRINVTKFLLPVLILLFTVAPVIPGNAAAPPGADLVAMDYSKGQGYAVLSRFELFLSAKGNSWESVGLSQRFEQFTSLALGKSTIYIGTAAGGVLKSTSGSPFQPVTVPADPFGRSVKPVRLMSVGPSDNQLLISSGQGVIRSDDGGETWNSVMDPFWNKAEAREVLSVSFIKKTPVVITRSGPFKWTKKGYVPFDKGLPKGSRPAVASAYGGKLMITIPGQGIFMATSASSWKKLASSPGDPVSFVGFARKGLLAARTASPLHFGDSKGKKWQKLATYTEGYLPIASLPTSSSTLVLLRGKGLMSLRDGNLHFVTLPANLANVGKRLELGGNTVAATQGGFFLSSDNGSSWSDITPPLMYSRVSSHLMLGDGRILVGTAGSGVYMSSDSGASWEAWNVALGTANTVRGLTMYKKGVLAATENGLMWTKVITEKGPAWTKADEKPRWQHINGGIGRIPLSDMEISGDWKYVGSFSSGIFSAKGDQDFKPVKGFGKRISDLDVNGNKIAAVVDQNIILSDGGKVSTLDRLPGGAMPTSVKIFGDNLYVGSTVGVYAWDGSRWSRTGSKVNQRLYPISRLASEGGRLKVLTSGAGSYFLQ